MRRQLCTGFWEQWAVEYSNTSESDKRLKSRDSLENTRVVIMFLNDCFISL